MIPARRQPPGSGDDAPRKVLHGHTWELGYQVPVGANGQHHLGAGGIGADDQQAVFFIQCMDGARVLRGKPEDGGTISIHTHELKP